MSSRINFATINGNKAPSAEDLNAIHALINGTYDSRKPWGAPVKFTGFDGISHDGLILTDYALEVRHRAPTNERTAVFRRADNSPAVVIESGILKAKKVVNDVASGDAPTAVIVTGTAAGGILGGTFPNPTFAIATEYHQLFPLMIMAWWGDLANIPVGWVLCDGATVTLRSGATFVTPNMTDKFPIGAGGAVTHRTEATGTNTWTTLATIDVTHTHSGTNLAAGSIVGVGASSRASINARPPAVGWHWIMKL